MEIRRPRAYGIALTALLFAPLAAAQSAAGRDDAAAAVATKAPTRIHVIGASVSGGFEDGPLFGAAEQGQSVTLRKILKAWCDGEVKVTSHPPLEMWNLFRDPVGIGEKEIALAKRRKPDLVFAVDFPFWFAYGYTRGDEAKARKELLEKGLAYLLELEVPVVIGDLPDMTGAATRMLRPAQIPSPELLAELNERLAAFAKEHDRVTLVPLSKFVKEMKVDGAALPLDGGALQTAPKALLQEDRLHATRVGMALLGYRLQDTLAQRFPEGHALHGRAWSFEEFVAAAGGEVELEALQAAAAAKR